MRLKTLTANRLIDGIAVWIAPDGSFTESPYHARVERDDDGYATLERLGADATRACTVVDAALVDVEITEHGPLPTKRKERIRALGPTVRLDLGKQAELSLKRVA